MNSRKSEIGNLIREYRDLRGISQAALAKLAGTSQGYISDLENGKISSPTIGVINRIARVLDIPNDVIARTISAIDGGAEAVDTSRLTKDAIVALLNKPQELAKLDTATLLRLKLFISAILEFAGDDDLTTEQLDLLSRFDRLPNCSRQAVLQLINSLEVINKNKTERS